MEIFIDDIPEEGLTIRADSKSDAWFLSALKDSIGDRFTESDEASIVVTFIKFEGNIDITGDLKVVSHPTCDRCLSEYREDTTLPFHLIMSPLYESKREAAEKSDAEKALVSEDMGFSFYEGDRIDLDEIVREQILLEEPIKHICKDSCKGLCQRCGANLNEGKCTCVETHHDPRWDVLKQFKIRGSKQKK